MSLAVGFSRADLTMTLTETFTVTLITPCAETVVSSTEVIPVLQYYFGDPALQYTFLTFSNTVAMQYGDPLACTIVYSLSLAADATTFGVSLLAGNIINAVTTTQSLIGQSVTLSLLGSDNVYPNALN